MKSPAFVAFAWLGVVLLAALPADGVSLLNAGFEIEWPAGQATNWWTYTSNNCGRATWAARTGSAGYSFYPAGNANASFGQTLLVNVTNGDVVTFTIYGKAEINYTNEKTRIGLEFRSGGVLQYEVTNWVYNALSANRGEWVQLRVSHTNTLAGIDEIRVRCDFANGVIPSGTSQATCQWDDGRILIRRVGVLGKFEPVSGVYLGVLLDGGGSASEMSEANTSAGKDHAVFAKFVVLKTDPFPWDWANAVTSACPGASLHIVLEPVVGFEDTFAPTWGPGQTMYEAARSFLTNCAAAGVPIFLRYGHEANGDWYPWAPDTSPNDGVTPETYIQGFRNFADLAHDLAPNVAMVWAPNQGNGPSEWGDYERVYPGDDYVDWVGMSVYNGEWYGNGNEVQDDQFKKAIESGYSQDDEYTNNDTAQNFYWTFADPDNPTGHCKPMMIAETSAQFVPQYAVTNAVQIAGFETLDGPTFIPQRTLACFSNLNWDVWSGTNRTMEEDFEDLGAWNWSPWGIFWSNTADAVSGTNALRMGGVPEAGSVYIGGNGRDLPQGHFQAESTLVNFQDLNHDAWVGISTAAIDSFESITAWSWLPWANLFWSNTTDCVGGTNALRMGGSTQVDSTYVGGNGRDLPEPVFVPATTLVSFQNLNHDAWQGTNQALVDSMDMLATWDWGPWGNLFWSNTADRVQGTNALRMGGAPEGGGTYVGGNGRNFAGSDFTSTRIIAQFQDLNSDGLQMTNSLLVDTFENITTWNWGPWGNLFWSNTSDRVQGTNAVLMGGTPNAGEAYVGGNGRTYDPDWSMNNGMELWMKCDSSTNPYPIVTVGLRCNNPDGTATVSRVITSESYGSQKIFFSNMTVSAGFNWSSIWDFTLELLSTEPGRRPRDVRVDKWSRGTLTNALYVDQDWWPGGTNCAPWKDDADTNGGWHAWALVSDPSESLPAGALRMSGTDKNTNGYIGGNGCSLTAANRDWSGANAMAVLVRRDGGTGVNPSLRIELIDGGDRTAAGVTDVTETNYLRMIIPYASMTVDSGFQWTNVQSVKFALFTSVAGQAPANLYVKQFEAGQSQAGPSRDWSDYDGMDIDVHRAAGTQPDPVLMLSVMSPGATATVVRTISNTNYEPLRVFIGQFDMQGAFNWSNITAMKMEMLSSVVATTPADLYVDDWRVVSLDLSDQDWWSGGTNCTPWADETDTSGGWHTWALVSDPFGSLPTNALRMSGTDKNTNGYIGGNAFSVLWSQSQWTHYTALALTVRRDGSSGVDPKVAVELVDSSNRTASGSRSVTSTNYGDVVIPFSEFVVQEGFAWDQIATAKLNMMTVSNGMPTADLYVKRWRLGTLSYSIPRDWRTYDAFEIWVKRALGSDPDPVLTVTLINPSGEGYVSRTVTNTEYAPLRVSLSELALSTGFSFANISALKIEMLSTESNSTPADLYVDEWRVVKLDLGDQDWWPGGTNCLPWAEDGDPAGSNTWTLVQDPAAGLMTNSLQISGFDGNTNGYIGGNGFSPLGPQQSWANFSAMEFIARRSDGAGVNPKIALELEDSSSRIASGNIEVGSTSYTNFLLSFAWMSVDSGFDWTRITAVKLGMMTVSNAMPTADLFIKQWRLGSMAYDVPVDWSSYHAIEIMAKRASGSEPNPVLVVGMISPNGNAGAPVEVTNTAYQPLRIYFADCGPTPGFSWAQITALKLEMMSTVADTRPADLCVDSWKLVKLELGDQDWWPGGTNCLPWGDKDDPFGTNVWSLVSDPAPGYSTNSLRIYGTDSNANYYIGGNGFNPVGPDTDWSSATHLGLTLRREGDANLVDPQLQITLVDNNARRALAYQVVYSSNYFTSAIAFDGMQADAGFNWSNIVNVVIDLTTTWAGRDPDVTYVKNMALGTVSNRYEQRWWKPGEPLEPVGFVTWTQSTDAMSGDYSLRISGQDPNGTWWCGANGCAVNAEQGNWTNSNALVFQAKRGNLQDTPDPKVQVILDNDYTEGNGNEAQIMVRVGVTNWSEVAIAFSDFSVNDGFSWANIQVMKIGLFTSVGGTDPNDLYLDRLQRATITVTNGADNLKWKRDWMDQLFSLQDGQSPDGVHYASILSHFRNLHMINWFHVKKFEDGMTKDFKILEDGGVPVYSSYYARISSSYFLSRVATDADEDGLSDEWETRYFGSPTAADSLAHGDTDGANNWSEYVAGTNPTNADSALSMEGDRMVGASSNFVVRWESAPWRLYSLQRSTNLTSGFTVLQSAIQSTPPENAYTDTVHGVGPYYYRVRLTP